MQLGLMIFILVKAECTIINEYIINTLINIYVFLCSCYDEPGQWTINHSTESVTTGWTTNYFLPRDKLKIFESTPCGVLLPPVGGVAAAQAAPPTSAAPSAAFFRPQPSVAQRSAALRSSVMKKLSKKMSEVMDQSSRPRALKALILKGCRSSKKAGLEIFLGFHTPCTHTQQQQRHLQAHWGLTR